MTEWQSETEVLLVEEIPHGVTVIQTVEEASQEVPLEITILTVVGIQGSQGRTALAKEDMAALVKMVHTVEDRVALTKILHTVGDMIALAKEVRTVGEIPTMTKHDNAMATATECQALAK